MDSNPFNNHEDMTMHEAAGISMQDEDMLEGTLVLVNELLESVTTGMQQDILETAITVLREAIREADGDSETKAKAEVALIKALITRFACHGWVEDLDEATRLLKGNEAIKSAFILELQMMGHEGEHYPEIVTFSLNLLHEYRQSIDKSNLDTAITVANEALASHHGVINHRAQLSLRAGNALVLRYLSCGDEKDFSLARALFHDAKEACGTGDPMLFIALVDLRHVGFVNFLESGMLQGMSGLQEMAQYGQAAQAEDQKGQEAYILGSELMQGDKLAIDEAILQFRRSLSLRPPQHPRRHDTLAHCALALGNRFGCTGQIKDLEESISLHKEALSLRPHGHPDRNFLDLDECIALHREALDLRPHGHPHRAGSLNNLANALSTRFDNKGDFRDLDECIALHREALDLHPHGHPDRASSLNNLAVALSTRFGNKGDFRDLDECIALHREALDLHPHGHPDRASSLNNLAGALSTRFDNKGDFRDLDECIALHREALDLHPHGHPDRASSLNNLAVALSTRFRNKGDFRDLDECIALHREALDLRPHGHPDRASSLNNLAVALSTRFDNKGDFRDLDECIALHREALDLRPHGHPHRAGLLNNLANALSTRFDNKGDFRDLDECIALHREALDLHPHGHPHRAGSLNNLANALSTCFDSKGDFRDLDKCIALHREALDLRPHGHPDRASSLNNLAVALSTRFGNKGDFRDLDECIALHREALDLRPHGHPHRAGSLNNLANALSTRFDNKGDFRDLDECIALHREALDLRPHGHPDRASSLNNLAGALSTRFDNKGDFRDLDECIALHREALSLFSRGNPHRAGSLNNLAVALSTRFRNKGDFRDLDECIALHREALSLFSRGNPHRAGSLNNLAVALSTRFRNKGDFRDLDECIALHREVLDLHPHGHPDRASSLNNLANALFARFGKTHDFPDLEECIRHRREHLEISFLSPEDQQSDNCALGNHTEGLKAIVSLVQSLRENYKHLGDNDTLQEIFALLETGVRCHGASPLVRLDHARLWASICREFHRPRTALDAYRHGISSLPVLASLDLTLEQRQNVLVYAKDLSKDAVQCAIEQNELDTALVFLSTARSVFWSQALQFRGSLDRLNAVHPDLASELRTVTRQLQFATDTTTTNSHNTVWKYPATPSLPFASWPGDEKSVFREDPHLTVDDDFKVVLRVLWDRVGQPVVQALRLEKTNTPRRIWWCPTGPFTFLPIHAAGNYTPSPLESECLSDYIVSSYCSTPQDLITPQPVPNPDFKMLVVIEPDRPEPGVSSLPSTRQELEKIKLHIPENDRLITRAGPKSSSGKSILDDINTASIVHFGCHGMQDPSNPLDSYLLLSDRRLTMSSLIRDCQTSTAALAYLSACETAMGDDQRPDESLTLAATMQFAGFRSVVATMWSIHDHDAPIVADAFYRHLFRHGTAAPPDVTDAAYGLHLAVKELREQGTSFHRWVPFVHHGV
ncbi:mucin-like protein 1 [Coprinopsis cinerea okayama7|uniref:Mucin-like protein 1 n=1 Tax=Coprinopsis cinerea (strain Okayama-7 / 130 / ATCC MYA-4618 / FGSC 9003) TaxID=240176 RepID=A8NR12_COPC7|nr:mucin-like protein 1 [Coprinopsis cinerea okayama7\|eukprot:XP_001835597.2 mucin-like protein 1 [Coprinopsis cinerea okayama7\